MAFNPRNNVYYRGFSLGHAIIRENASLHTVPWGYLGIAVDDPATRCVVLSTTAGGSLTVYDPNDLALPVIGSISAVGPGISVVRGQFAADGTLWVYASDNALYGWNGSSWATRLPASGGFALIDRPEVMSAGNTGRILQARSGGAAGVVQSINTSSGAVTLFWDPTTIPHVGFNAVRGIIQGMCIDGSGGYLIACRAQTRLTLAGSYSDNFALSGVYRLNSSGTVIGFFQISASGYPQALARTAEGGFWGATGATPAIARFTVGGTILQTYTTLLSGGADALQAGPPLGPYTPSFTHTGVVI